MRTFTPIGWPGSTATESSRRHRESPTTRIRADQRIGRHARSARWHSLRSSLFPVAQACLILAMFLDSEARQLLLFFLRGHRAAHRGVLDSEWDATRPISPRMRSAGAKPPSASSRLFAANWLGKSLLDTKCRFASNRKLRTAIELLPR